MHNQLNERHSPLGKGGSDCRQKALGINLFPMPF